MFMHKSFHARAATPPESRPQNRIAKKPSLVEGMLPESGKKRARVQDAERAEVFSPLHVSPSPYMPRSTFLPIRMTNPLPEPDFVNWRTASEEVRKGLVAGFLKSVRRAESYIFMKYLRMGVPIDARGESGETALMAAAYWRHTKVARTLIEKGADVNAVDKRKDSVLVYAAEGGREELVSLLLKEKAIPSEKALEAAVAEGNKEAAKLIREALRKKGR